MPMTLTQLAPALVSALIAGCATLPGSTPKLDIQGELKGKVHIAWDGPQDYVYLPASGNELAYTIPDKFALSDDGAVNGDAGLRRIEPELMYTDGGSIPRILWSAEGLSPLDYLPAYVIHDWLYFQHRCHGTDASAYARFKDFPYTRELVDEILRESLDQVDAEVAAKQRARGSGAPQDKAAVRNAIFVAVKNFGGKAWKASSDKSTCRRPPSAVKIVSEPYRKAVRTILRDGRSIPIYEMRTRTRQVPRYEILATASAGG